MSAAPQCPRCGEPLPGDAPAGLCPACLLRMVHDGDSGILTGSGAGQQPRHPTTDGSPARSDGSRTWNYLCETASYHSPTIPRRKHATEREGARPTPPVDVDRFLEALGRLGLREQAGVEEAVERFLCRPGPKAAEDLARELVRGGRLTEYQAGAILQGKSRGLALGNYLVLDKIGVGGMGMVFKAVHRRMRRTVALKILPPSFARSATAVMRFHREAEAAARLSHPNVVAVLDADEFNGLHFFAMEYVAGEDLERRVAADGPLSVRSAIEYVAQAARGLGAAHALGIYHRDIKPSNLLLDRQGVIKVLDLGLARMDKVGESLGSIDVHDGLTHAGDLLGTIAFMSPEQAYNAQDADHRSDIYSLGCTFYYLLAGRVPYSSVTRMACLFAHRENPIPRLCEARPEVSPILDVILARMMAKAPEDRYPSMETLIADLETSLAILTDAAAMPDAMATPPRPAETPSRSSRHRRGPAIIAFVVGLAALVLVVAVKGPFRTRSIGPEPQDANIRADVTVRPVPPGTEDDSPGESAAEPERNNHPEVPPAESERIGEVRQFRPHGDGVVVESVAVSHDGRHALSGGHDFAVRYWDIKTGEELWRNFHDKEVWSVALAMDWRLGLSGSGDRTLRLWDVEKGKLIGPLPPGHERPVNSVAILPNGQLALSGSNDGTVRVWSLETWREVDRRTHDRPVNAVAFSRDGSLALSGSDDRSVRIWNLGTPHGAAIGRLDCPSAVWCLAVSKDGRQVLAGCTDGTLTLWEPGSRKQTRFKGPQGDWVRCVTFLADDKRALSGTQNGRLILWDVEGAQELQRFEGEAAHLGIAALPDGRHALTADKDGIVRLWNLGVPNGPKADPEMAEVPKGR